MRQTGSTELLLYCGGDSDALRRRSVPLLCAAGELPLMVDMRLDMLLGVS